MTNPRYVYMPVWRFGPGSGSYMLDGSSHENFIMDLETNYILSSEIKKVFFTLEEAMDSWQDTPKDAYLVIRIDLATGKWEMVL